MEKRQLGRSGILVAPLAFGGNVFGWTADQAMSFRLLDAFVAGGFNLIDTADVYSRWKPGNSGGESETIIGAWLKARGNRQQVVIATKLGSDMGEGKKGLSRAYMLRAVEDSLRRLQTDYIDLYQSHRDDPDTPMTEVLETYLRLIEQGKVRAIGASNFTAARLAEALETSRRHGLPRYESLQPLYNLVERAAFEGELEALCRREQIGVINYYSLASGFGKISLRSGPRRSRAGRRGGKVSERAWAARPCRAGRHSCAPSRHAGADRIGLAARAARHHRTDRQRDQSGAMGGTGDHAGDQARQPGDCAARSGERLIACPTLRERSIREANRVGVPPPWRSPAAGEARSELCLRVCPGGMRVFWVGYERDLSGSNRI